MIRRGDDGSAVDTGVISVRDQGGAVDFLTNTNAEDRDSFVSEKADNRGSYHCAQIRYLLGMHEPLYAFVSHDYRARENRQHDCDPG